MISLNLSFMGESSLFTFFTFVTISYDDPSLNVPIIYFYIRKLFQDKVILIIKY